VTLSPHSDIAQMVRKLLVEPTLADRLGLQRGDLDGAARGARADLMAGRSGEAMGKFARLVLIDPTNAAFHIGLAEASLAEGHGELAMQAAATVIVDRPDHPDGYLLSARAALALGDLAAAAEDLADADRFAQARGDSGALAAVRRLRAVLARKSGAA